MAGDKLCSMGAGTVYLNKIKVLIIISKIDKFITKLLLQGDFCFSTQYLNNVTELSIFVPSR